MGGLLGGSSTSAFGARSASALSKLTRGAVGIFFLLVFVLALLTRSRNTGFEDEVKQQQQQQSTEWWNTENNKEDTGTTETITEPSETTTEPSGESTTNPAGTEGEGGN